MPKILEYIGSENGVEINTTSLCFPNYAIIDHLQKGLVQKVIASKPFKYVITQQGPSSQAAGKSMLETDGAKLKQLADKHNATLGYFMVWPSKRYYFTFDKVIENHTNAAQKNNALLFAVGKVWKQYNTFKSLENLYDYDEFHPSKAGSFLAALTIFHQLHPTKKLHLLPHSPYKKWVKDEVSFRKIIALVIQQ
ncbi:MAG: SGNH/GDSL hydrolase family protein [Tenacibaculum sp.]